MIKKRKNIRQRQRKKKVSALDIYEEFEEESINHSIEMKSKLTASEQKLVQKNYESATKVLTAEKEGQAPFKQPLDDAVTPLASSIDKINLKDNSKKVESKKGLNKALSPESVIKAQSIRNQNIPITSESRTVGERRLRNQSVIKNDTDCESSKFDYVINTESKENPNRSNISNLGTESVINTQSNIKNKINRSSGLRNQYVIKLTSSDPVEGSTVKSDYVINTQSIRNQDNSAENPAFNNTPEQIKDEGLLAPNTGMESSQAPTPPKAGGYNMGSAPQGQQVADGLTKIQQDIIPEEQLQSLNHKSTPPSVRSNGVSQGQSLPIAALEEGAQTVATPLVVNTKIIPSPPILPKDQSLTPNYKVTAPASTQIKISVPNEAGLPLRPEDSQLPGEIVERKENNSAELNAPLERLEPAVIEPLKASKKPPKVRNQSVINAQSERNQSVINAQSERNQSVINTQSHAQSRAQSERNQIFDYFSLAPMEEKILMYLFELCVKTGSKLTPRIRYQQIAQGIPTTEKTAKNTCQRLIRKGAIVREQYSKGPGSKTSFSIPREAYEQIFVFTTHKDFSFKTTEPQTQVRNQYVINAQSHAQSHAQSNPPSKLDRNFKNSNLTTEPEENQKPYDDIDLAPVRAAGITRKQLRDIHNQKLSLTNLQLQDLVDKFAEYYNENKDKIRRPTGLFVRMAQQLAGGDDPLPHIESGADIELQNLKKQLLAKKAAREKHLREIQSLMFESWWDSSTDVDREQLVPKHLTSMPRVYRSAVFQAWSNEIWPTTPEAKGLVGLT